MFRVVYATHCSSLSCDSFRGLIWTLTDTSIPNSADFYVQRPEIFEQVKSKVLSQKSVAIVGMDNLLGIGTSTLAAAVARDPEVKAEYRGGVFWLGFENDADDRTKLNHLLVRLYGLLRRLLFKDELTAPLNFLNRTFEF
eukprot:scaffold61526_cov49-Prasinocladus_malaysianus.AAC.1